MYQEKKSVWQQHGDFIILDLLLMQIAYLIAYSIRLGLHLAYSKSIYREVAVIPVLIGLFLGFLWNPMRIFCEETSLLSLKRRLYMSLCVY